MNEFLVIHSGVWKYNIYKTYCAPEIVFLKIAFLLSPNKMYFYKKDYIINNILYCTYLRILRNPGSLYTSSDTLIALVLPFSLSLHMFGSDSRVPDVKL